MNMLNIFIVYVLNIRSERDLLKVKKIFFLENHFWCDDRPQLLTEKKGYVNKLGIGIEHKSFFISEYGYHSETSYFLKSTNVGYFILDKFVQEAITSFLESPKDMKVFLRFSFIFTDKLIEKYNFDEDHEEKKQEYTTYKFLERTEDKNSIKLRWDESDIRLQHIKDRLGKFLFENLLGFNEYINFLDVKKNELSKLEDIPKVDFYSFKNYSECCENLKKFIGDLCFFDLVDDDKNDSSTSESPKMLFNETTTLTVSDFEERLCIKFFENLKKSYNVEIDEHWEEVLGKCCDCLENIMLENITIFPIIGKYDIDYYIEEISNFIYETAIERQKKYASFILRSNKVSFPDVKIFLSNNFKSLQARIAREVCESEFIPKHFSKILGREVKTLEDYIEVEKMVCDYINMFGYICDLYNRLNDKLYISYSVISPIFIDDYNLKLVDGIKIEINLPVKFRDIKGFDDKGEEVIMIKDTDYFVDKSGIIYCPSEALKMKNIQEIKILTYGGEKNNNKFKVKEYLSI